MRRAIEAVEAAGKTIAAVDFPREGGFRLVIGDPAALAPSSLNEWDEVLNTELRIHEEKYAAREELEQARARRAARKAQQPTRKR
ncbi:hypothetical protein BZG35_03580 [Brevundimonas sp. LM2]|nr:hypothetical protein BZG35_03580 [Brevundimonas sp. LM2]